MERLNFENLGFAKMKRKLRLHLSLTVAMISQLNPIQPHISLSDSTTLSFFRKATNFK